MSKPTRKIKPRVKKVSPKSPEIMLNVMANNPTELLYNKLQLFYKGAFENSIAFMVAKDTVTGEEAEILVGYDFDPQTGKIDVYPLAKLIPMEDSARYIAPTGRGGYIGEETEEEASVGSND